MNKQNNLIDSEKKEELFTYKKKDNYDADTPEKNINFINDDIINKNENKFQIISINQTNKKKEEKIKNNEEFIVFPKNNEEDDNKIRISNLKDIELPLEDKLQIEKQVDNDNDNESEQIEVLENILNNFGKEKYQNKFFIYKNKKKNILKSTSVPKSKNNTLLNKIKHDIALINFEQEINKICNNHNHDLVLKGEKININVINNKINNNKSKNNILRIESIRKKLFPGMSISIDPLGKSLNDHRRNDNRIFINNNNQENNYYNSCNNFYNNNNKKKQRIYKSLFNDNNNGKQIKINNYNFNNIYNNFFDTFRYRRINVDNENKIILPVNTKRKNNSNSHFKTDESKNSSNNDSNLFFYNVFKNSVKKYPNLYLLKNKVNKMKNDDYNQQKLLNNIYKIDEKKEIEKKKEDPKISILDKINMQKDIFQKEIDKYKKNN